MKKTFMRRILSVVVCLALYITCTSYVFATSYTYYMDYGYYSSSIDINVSGMSQNSPSYFSCFNSAVNNWNSPPASTYDSFTYSSSSNNLCFVSYVDDAAFGFYEVYDCTSTGYHRTTEFNIKLNSKNLSGKSVEFVRSTSCHELGHAQGLNDHTISDLIGSSIMHNNRNRNSVYTPCATDCDVIQANWAR